MSNLADILPQHGYTVEESTVHGKNQTRFAHWVLQKDGEHFFGKANNTDGEYALHLNSTLTKLFKDVPEGISFLAPVDEVSTGGQTLYIYPFIDQRPVSNESQDFDDFLVPEEDIDLFLRSVLSTIRYIEQQQFVTAKKPESATSSREIALRLLAQLPTDTPYAVEFLQYVLSDGKDLAPEHTLAINDIQPQNMFWNAEDKTLINFDLEHMAPNVRYYDYAKFCAQLWIVCGREDVARRFASLFFLELPSETRGEAYRFFRFNLTVELLVAYTVFREKKRQKRIPPMMNWMRQELLNVANGQ